MTPARADVVDWRADGVAWLAFALAVALMSWALAPGLSWLDAGELVAAARELGNIHPPGHPAWLSLAGLADLLPLGPYAARVAWLSALGAGVSAWLTVRLARLVAAEVPRPAQDFLVAATVVTLLASASLWQVSVRVEVYTLALAGNLWALYAALRAGRAAQAKPQNAKRILAPLAQWVAATCLGLLNHHYVALFAVPATLVAAWPALLWAWRAQRRWLGWLVLGGALLGLGYLALPLRSLADTEMRWGNPATLQGFWDTLTARHFQRAVMEPAGSPVEHALVLLGMIADGLGGWLALLGGLGLTLGVLVRNRLQATLWLALLGALLTKALMRIDTRNPDDHGYVLLAVAVVALGVAQLGGILWQSCKPGKARARSVAGLALAVTVLAVLQVPTLVRETSTNQASLRAPDVLDSHLRASLPPGALYLTNYFGLAFNEQAFRIAEGRRPDLVAPHLTFRTGDTDQGQAYQLWFSKRHPELRQLAVAAAGLGKAPVGNILPLVEKMPVYAELDPENRIPAPYFHFDGVAHRLLTRQERGVDYDLGALRRHQSEVWNRLQEQLQPPDLQDHPTRSVLAWQHALEVAHALRRGWMNLADDEIKRARELSPQDKLLDALSARQQALAAAWQRADVKGFAALWQRWSAMDFDTLAGSEP